MLVGKIWSQFCWRKERRKFSRNVAFLGLRFIPSRSGKIKVLARKQNFGLSFFWCCHIQFHGQNVFALRVRLVAKRKSQRRAQSWETRRKHQASRCSLLPLTLNPKWAQRVEPRMVQTGTSGKEEIMAVIDDLACWYKMLFLVLFHYSPRIKKKGAACLWAACRRWLHQRRSAHVHPELFKNTDVLLILCIKAPNLKDKEV